MGVHCSQNCAWSHTNHPKALLMSRNLFSGEDYDWTQETPPQLTHQHLNGVVIGKGLPRDTES